MHIRGHHQVFRTVSDEQIHNRNKANYQQGPTVYTGSSAQYSVIAYVGKKSEKNEHTYNFIYANESLCCIPGTNTTL